MIWVKFVCYKLNWEKKFKIHFHTINQLNLGSTHGSYINNKRVDARRFVKIKPGAFVKFGGSTRHFVLQSDDNNLDEETGNKTSSEKTDAIFMKNSNHEKSLKKDENEKKQEEAPSLKELYKGLLEKKYGSRNGGNPTAKLDGLVKGGGEEGIGWGIMDEDVVYRQQNEDEMSLEPELLRDLPDLNEKQREKIDKYEQKLEK